jgi:hypothetical protein
VVLRLDPEVRAPVTPPAADRGLELWIDAAPAGGAVVGHTAWVRLDERGYAPPPLAVDLFRVASAVFTADLRIRRKEAFDGWTRDLVLHLPVSDVVRWEGVQGPLLRLLAYLTGDHWEVGFYPASRGRPAPGSSRPLERQPFPATAACLLSGGLDSFIGAADALARRERLALVSHNAAGTATAGGPAQSAIVAALREQYTPASLRHVPFFVNAPKQGFTGVTEDTTRSRSIIFLALGVLVASSLSEGARRLIVPENGLISLNAPLTDNRLGSLSTKTTHPYTIALFRDVLAGLGLGVEVETPYQVTTKGEMLTSARDREFVGEWAPVTVSCARPTQARYQRDDDPRAKRMHCGYCVPCIIRRAAMFAAGLDSADDYRRDLFAPEVLDDPRRRENLLAFRIAIERLRAGGGPADVLASGPLGSARQPVADLVDVHRRGLEEVAAFLGGRPAGAAAEPVP